ncbi:TolC family outer membrane protein [Govanella unica]|uniref:TolC family outer membrane protein n=1 Tax=Govanella unica TaxID=2975056 RepID=A0A9X3TX37_9PROT|nr:TolC family outer membrane protein [Govania unica]MDA5193285.1 TolC family outer membrane protein [Govania unica]
MRFPLIAVVAVCLGGPLAAAGAVQAETLQETLAAAYANNPSLEASRAQLRAIDENVAQARGGYRPTVEASGAIGRADVNQTSLTSSTGNQTYTTDGKFTSKNASVALVQPVFSGFSTVNSVKKAEHEVLAGREDLRNAEQSMLLDAVTSFMNVKRDEAILDLNRSNVQVLQRQLDASQDRFRVGEITRTDVAQSEARLSRALSDRTRAEANLSASRAFYKRVVGQAPGTLEAPAGLPALPENEDAAYEVGLASNPVLNSARYAEQASSYAVGAAKGSMLPKINLRAEYSRGWDNSLFSREANQKQVTAELRIPLYEAGVASSQVRQARQINSQRRLQIIDVERQVSEAVRNAWQNMRAASDRVKSDESQVRANEIALEGVKQEAEVGSRTVLDVLNAEQELLDSRVLLVGDKRDEQVAAYSLLAAIGQMTAEDLNVAGERYNPKKNYDRVSGKIWGWDIPE